MTTTDELRARLFLMRAAEPPAPAVYDYVSVHGPVETADHIRGGTAPSAVLAEITRPEAGSSTTSGRSRTVSPGC